MLIMFIRKRQYENNSNKPRQKIHRHDHRKVEHMLEYVYGSIEVDGKLVSYIKDTIIDGDRIVSVEVSEK